MKNTKQFRFLRPVLALGLAFGLTACASVETATRAAPVPLSGALTTGVDAPAPAALPSFNVTQVNVEVPQSLRVSEANRYYPSGDIVWREDPLGDRHAQVAAIVQAGLERGVARLPEGGRPVIMDITVTRFHALTEKARYTVGGVHAIQFEMRLRDAETGAVVVAPTPIKADFKALGGAAAVASEAKGITQKVRITDQLAKVIQQQLADPQGYVAENTGMIGALNQI